jgi:hypothetical protein
MSVDPFEAAIVMKHIILFSDSFFMTAPYERSSLGFSDVFRCLSQELLVSTRLSEYGGALAALGVDTTATLHAAPDDLLAKAGMKKAHAIRLRAAAPRPKPLPVGGGVAGAVASDGGLGSAFDVIPVRPHHGHEADL